MMQPETIDGDTGRQRMAAVSEPPRQGEPATAGRQGGIIPGFANALIGQTVGSQVVTVIPPAQGYGAAAQASIPAGSQP